MVNIYNEERYETVNSIVKILKMYGQVTVKQAMVILDKSEDVIRSNFKTTLKQKIAYFDEVNDALVINSINEGAYNKKLGRSLDLLVAIMKENPEIDFWESINQTDNEPCTIFFQTDDVLFDIVYVSKGEEKRANNKMTRLNMDSNFLVIVEHPAQVEYLTFNGISAFYTISEGEVVSIE